MQKQKRALPRTPSCSHPDLELLVSRLWEAHFCHLGATGSVVLFITGSTKMVAVTQMNLKVPMTLRGCQILTFSTSERRMRPWWGNSPWRTERREKNYKTPRVKLFKTCWVTLNIFRDNFPLTVSLFKKKKFFLEGGKNKDLVIGTLYYNILYSSINNFCYMLECSRRLSRIWM